MSNMTKDIRAIASGLHRVNVALKQERAMCKRGTDTTTALRKLQEHVAQSVVMADELAALYRAEDVERVALGYPPHEAFPSA